MKKKELKKQIRDLQYEIESIKKRHNGSRNHNYRLIMKNHELKKELVVMKQIRDFWINKAKDYRQNLTPLQALEELRGIEPSEPVKGVLGESTQEQFEEFQKAFNGFMDQVHNPKNLMEILGLESTDINGNPV
jgi:chromosome segregation ATPase